MRNLNGYVYETELTRKRVGKWEGKTLTQPRDVISYLGHSLEYRQDQESFFIIPVDAGMVPYGVFRSTIGLVNQAQVHPRETFRVAIMQNAVAVFIAHNHPSGNDKPSAEDIVITQRLIEAGRIIDINVMDHIVIGDNKWSSIRTQHPAMFAAQS